MGSHVHRNRNMVLPQNGSRSGSWKQWVSARHLRPGETVRTPFPTLKRAPETSEDQYQQLHTYVPTGTE